LGWALGTFGGRLFETGVEEQMRRLKQAAEARYRGASATA
jgi:hypothetical protein